MALEAVVGLLPRIAAFMAKLPEDKRDPSWLPDLILGFAADCHDSGLLRDVATVLTGDPALQAAQSATLLRALADTRCAQRCHGMLQARYDWRTDA